MSLFTLLSCKNVPSHSLKAHLAAGELVEMWFEILSYHSMDGHQAKHTGFPHTALRVIVTLLKPHKTNQISAVLYSKFHLQNQFPSCSMTKPFMALKWYVSISFPIFCKWVSVFILIYWLHVPADGISHPHLS